MDDAREVVRIFNSDTKMQKAIDPLLISGFNHADVTLLASDFGRDDRENSQPFIAHVAAARR